MILTLDVETTTLDKGNPFNEDNKLCTVVCNETIYRISYGDGPYAENLQQIQQRINEASLIVGFNIKFDLHWLRRYGISIGDTPVWDCQLVHFITTYQTTPYPSLNDVCAHHSLACKLDVVKNEYWDHGIDTPDIPWEVLSEYALKDVELTRLVYDAQQRDLPEHMVNLVKLANRDLTILEEMEWNGMTIDVRKNHELIDGYAERLTVIDSELARAYPLDGINWNSNDHVSAVLYGGVIKLRVREATERILKDGTVKHGERWGIKEVPTKQLVKPPKGIESKKEGNFKVGEDVLASLSPSSNLGERIIQLLLERSKLERKVSSYRYDTETIHGQLNQCVARTGRLSSSNPNMQNIDGEIKQCFVSRYVN